MALIFFARASSGRHVQPRHNHPPQVCKPSVCLLLSTVHHARAHELLTTHPSVPSPAGHPVNCQTLTTDLLYLLYTATYYFAPLTRVCSNSFLCLVRCMHAAVVVHYIHYIHYIRFTFLLCTWSLLVTHPLTQL